MQALAARELDEAFELDAGKPLAHVARCGDQAGPRHPLARIEIEHEPAGQFGIARLTVPGMQLGRAHLRHGGQTLDPVDLEGIYSLDILNSLLVADDKAEVKGLS